MKNIVVKDKIINITGINEDDSVSLTDLARFLNEDDPRYPIQNWMRLKDTIDFIGLWEILKNDNFNRIEFDAVKEYLILIELTEAQKSFKYSSEADVLNVLI